ncbi:MAG: hypothetical protein LLF82_000558 [Dehalococcoides mccartyi]|uniref:hypothetical protein n=1 Tax=Dehalococcoides mccartyi TaxID=61435 RepID=UPI00098F1A42|nr:hypothetical protein [Dehalococcoides mccartyi]AQU03760.1 hypothetical protein B1773_07120 [Dehalococcoides mccartyi]AQU05062.1 hypothetical protein B1774_06770 [Dehalococcoides mccartyi]MCF7635080.1 hypothetical protein [Dehalococcoides mccartyi]MEA2121696.1 hypothetical protein [Dehalococcoides mccartyi]MEA2122286.1 hypothetical protein [Dehalococcoides mccartyi]
MPREDDTYRNAMYNGHPPACTCVDCTRRRLAGNARRKSVERSLFSWIIIGAVVLVIIMFVLWWGSRA